MLDVLYLLLLPSTDSGTALVIKVTLGPVDDIRVGVRAVIDRVLVIVELDKHE